MVAARGARLKAPSNAIAAARFSPRAKAALPARKNWAAVRVSSSTAARARAPPPAINAPARATTTDIDARAWAATRSLVGVGLQCGPAARPGRPGRGGLPLADAVGAYAR